MKIALVGYGKMGRLLEQLASQAGCEVTLVLDEHNNKDGAGLTPENFRNVEAAIEFTSPEIAPENLLKLATLRVPAVCGTTGWFARLPEIRAAVEANHTALVYGANFSIGVNLFAKIVAEAAHLFAGHPDYEAWAWEIHHSAKKDAPSGTLLKLVAEMNNAGYFNKIDVSSNRAGAIPGTHEIGFDSPADTITLRHTARSREGFARGALHAAKWITGKKGCWEFSQILFGSAKEAIR
jgi:4-hydroxy-tetrahydrodipicolinate reductase